MKLDHAQRFRRALRTSVLSLLLPLGALADVPQPAVITTASTAVALPDAANDPTRQIIVPLPQSPRYPYYAASPVGVSLYGLDRALINDSLHSGVYVVDTYTGAYLDTIPTYNAGHKGYGTIAVSPDQSVALASGDYQFENPPFYLYVIRAPFDHQSAVHRIQLPERTHVGRHTIVYDKRGRAFVRYRGGIAVVDPPYTSIAFTIPVHYATHEYFNNIHDFNVGEIAITPDGNTLLVISHGWSTLGSGDIYEPSPDGNEIRIYRAPFSPNSTAETLTVNGSNGGPDGLHGIEIAPDGKSALVTGAKYEGYNPDYRRSYAYVFAITAPFSAGSAVGQLQLPPGYDDPEAALGYISISADSKAAIITGHTAPMMVRGPFSAGSATSSFPIQNHPQYFGWPGGVAVSFRPPGINISKHGPRRIGPDEKITYTLSYSNNGPDHATNFIIRDPLPEGTKFVSATDGGRLIGDTVVWDMGTVFVGTASQVSFTVEVTALPGAVITNREYTADADNFDSVTGGPVETFMVSGDLLIKTAEQKDTGWAADNIYVASPAGHQLRLDSFVPRPGAAQEYDVELQNDAKAARTYRLSGYGSFGNWKVEALVEGVDRWSEISDGSAGGMSTGSLPPGGKMRIRMRLGGADPTRAVPIGSYGYFYLSTYIEGSFQMHDTVGAHVQAVPIDVTLRRANADGLTASSIEAGKTSIDAPLVFKPDPSLLATQPEISEGLVADGVTPLLFEIVGPRDDSEYDIAAEIVGGGTVAGAPVAERLRILKNGQWSADPRLKFSRAQERQFACFTPVASDDVKVDDGAKEIEIRLTFKEAESGDDAAAKSFKLRKPPVALVHGYNTGGDWGEGFAKILGTSRSRLTADGAPDFIQTIRYGQQPSGAGDTEKQNTTLPFTDLVPILDAEYATLREAFSARWALTRYDAVCHSQGGVLTRLLTSRNGNMWMPLPFRNPDNFYRGRFHRVVTIGSPHNGTRIVRYITALQERFANTHGIQAALAIPGAIADRLIGNGTVQDKFDPIGPQITAINRTDPTAPWPPDPDARIHLVQTTVNSGQAPSASGFSLSELGLGLETTGASVIPRGSDGVVDFDSMGATMPEAGQSFPSNVFRMPAERQISHAFVDVNGADLGMLNELKPIQHGVPVDLFGGEDGQVDSMFVAQHVIAALDQRDTVPASERVFGPFRLGARMPQAVIDQIDVAADRVSVGASAIKRVGASSADGLQAMASVSSATSVEFEFELPAGATLSAPVTWSAERYGAGEVSSSGVVLAVVPGHPARVSVSVDSTQVGDVVLYGTARTTTGNIIVGAPVLVSSVEPDPSTFALQRIEVLPAQAEFPIGGTFQPQLYAIYNCIAQACPALELRLRRWIDPAEFAVSSSAPAVVDVTEERLWRFSGVGDAIVSATWRGKTATCNFTIYDSAVGGVDSDGDGVTDARESEVTYAAGMTGDGNGDSMHDSQQSHVASLLGVTGRWSTLISPANRPLRNVQPSGPPTLDNLPAGYTFGAGFTNFVVTGVPVGGAVALTQRFPAGSFYSTVFGFGPTPQNTQPHWYEFLFAGVTGAQINGSQLTLHLVDGGVGDHDLQANGQIISLLAPAYSASSLADLVVTHTVAPPQVRRGQNVTYTIAALNNGPATAENVRFTDSLPAGLTFISAPGCAESGGTVTCELGAIPSGESASVSIVAHAEQVGAVTNTATAFALNEAQTDNNLASAVLTVNAAPAAPPFAYASSGAVPIPVDDVNFTSTAESPIAVSGITTPLSKVRVRAHIKHPYDSDLELYLVAPDGSSVALSLRNGGSGDDYGTDCPADGNDTTFDDQAADHIWDGDAPFVGEFRPEESLSNFVGKSGAAVNGTWKLRVVDTCACEGGGSIECWSLDLIPETEPPILPAITRFSPAEGLPGSSVTLFGTHLSAVTAVAFNGATANFQIVSGTEIVAVVPAGATTGPITVTSAEGTSASSSHFTVLTDTDTDGMADRYERQHFGSVAAGVPAADSDGDGATNAAEYRAGTNPQNAGSVFRVAEVRRQGSDFVISFAAVAGKRYRVEAGDAPGGNFPTLVSTISPVQNDTTVAVTDVGGATRPRRFYRVVVLP